ncbi:ergothioneine biosynthesis protein EgtB [Sphingorhabdus sp. Alg239-R122]|uniref:ergothioneine biosynthesis protein EgtB n=1 Tax=Sphingorhabdus sp. Alg239-R122 TaxID=2305989 RepID=UPI001F086BAF|nr:ergothioneine biosynthesis protein EgtB [Sphingorhabdus sp. Alg239-R122]
MGDSDLPLSPLAAQYSRVRGLTTMLVQSLSDADATVQSMEDASPAKWHLAHTTWFFETFVLRDHVPGYQPFDPDYHFLFNSYYEAEGQRHARARRGMITRPSLEQVLRYRAHVDEAMPSLLEAPGDAEQLIILGLNHEQQHQELLMTDIKHMFAQNPLKPAMFAHDDERYTSSETPCEWIEGRRGIVEIGHDGGGFAFDCEGPRHEALLTPHALASRPVSNAEWIKFIEDGGYENPQHWLSDGWAWVQQNDISAPLYWEKQGNGRWGSFALTGESGIDLHAPVTHISLYEADAYASWAGARLPTEAEWESAAAALDSGDGHFLSGHDVVRPVGAAQGAGGLRQMFGDVWEWTGSAFRPYPGFRAAKGAVGEYNGKFMSGQFVLKGGSCATPEGHIRASYRNFFYPHQRWQFTGLRLASDL